jgi:hypothetical protein
MFAELGEDWPEIAQRSGEIQVDILRVRFPALTVAVFQDVLVEALRAKDSESRLLRPFISFLAKGPFSRSWSSEESHHVAATLFEFGLPLLQNGGTDWLEFHALCKLPSQENSRIRDFTTRLIDAIETAPVGTAVVLESFELLPAAVQSRRARLELLKHIRDLDAHPPSEFRGQAGLPPNWRIEQDRALLSGICRFGMTWISGLADRTDDTRLSGFREFLSDNEAILQRIRIVIVANRAIRRTVMFWAGPLRRFAFTISRPDIPFGPKDKRHKKMTEKEKERKKELKEKAMKEMKEREKEKEKEKEKEREKETETEKEKDRKLVIEKEKIAGEVKEEHKPGRLRLWKERPPQRLTRVVFQYDALPKKILFVD